MRHITIFVILVNLFFVTLQINIIAFNLWVFPLFIYFHNMKKRFCFRVFILLGIISFMSGCGKNKFVHSYESCGFSYGAFTLHEDGSVTHYNYGSNVVKGNWRSNGNTVIIEGIPDYSGTYKLDGENHGIALKSTNSGRRFCSEY